MVASGKATTWLEHFPLLDEVLMGPLPINDGKAARSAGDGGSIR